MIEISKDQIQDAVGTYEQAATDSGFVFERERPALVYPSFEEIALALRIDTPLPDALQLGARDLLAQENNLRELGGTRVLAGIKTKNGAAYVPGIVLPDLRQTVRIGVLMSRHDVRPPTERDARRPLSDLQHILLGKIAAQHSPDVGKHHHGAVNVADIGHAVLIAATPEPENIHGLTHKLLGDDHRGPARPSLLSAGVAQTGATDLWLRNGDTRQNKEDVFTLNRLASVVITRLNQVPLAIDLDAFELSAGFTSAALQTQTTDRPKPNLQVNLEQMQQDY